MKFEEVLPALREGKKIRKIGSRNYYYLENGKIRECSGAESMGALFGNDCLLSDWEIVKEPKKVKLRDLTIKQYNKWLKSNCDKRCNNCIFRKVDCYISDSILWIINKDIYNDKFLDQEVEIEE